jgi:hypothetical protein
MSSFLLATIGLNKITLALFLLLALGSAVSPFNAFLRSKCFSDGYRWRGINRDDAIPLLKTAGLTLAWCAGALATFLEGKQSHGFYWIFLGLLVATMTLSICYPLWKAQRAKKNRC